VEQYLFIELLWIIPIIGFGVFVSILVFLIHNKYAAKGNDAELSRRVNDFNTGAHHRPASPEAEQAAAELEKRLSELEGAIESLTKSITAQQKTADFAVIDGAVADAAAANHPQELKQMLEAMRREYDAILHENRTLRSQFMRLLSDEGKTPKIAQPKTNLKLFDDTRYISPENFDDTADFEFSNSG
jgi:hypothetical protein